MFLPKKLAQINLLENIAVIVRTYPEHLYEEFAGSIGNTGRYMGSNNFISASEALNLSHLLQCRAERTPNALAYRQCAPGKDEWASYTWSQVQDEVERWRKAFHASGLEPGDRVAVMLRNSVEWVFFEQGAVAAGLVVVPIYFRDTPGNASSSKPHSSRIPE